MSSHVHWVLVAGEEPSCSFIKPLHCGFAGWLNRQHGRLGPVFADRHRTITFAGETAATLLAYVHNNPVRAGVVEDPSESAWTSHRAYIEGGDGLGWLDVARGLELAGFPATRVGRRAFHEFVATRRGEARCSMMSGSGLQKHRAEARREAEAPVEVGSPTVTMRRGRRVMIVPTVVPPGCKVRRQPRSVAAQVIRAVAQHLDVPAAAVQSRSRARSVVAVRRVALLVWCRHLRRPAVHMARALGIASSTASELLATAPRQLTRLAAQIAKDAMVSPTSE
ncbi:MAG: hypothetical protein ABW252_11235 [Polyangiales bacterium]